MKAEQIIDILKKHSRQVNDLRYTGMIIEVEHFQSIAYELSALNEEEDEMYATNDNPFGVVVRNDKEIDTNTPFFGNSGAKIPMKETIGSTTNFKVEAKEHAYEPYFGWCDVSRCKNEGCSGGVAWRETGYWTVCSEHAASDRNGDPQPKMKQSAIKREKSRDKITGYLPAKPI